MIRRKLSVQLGLGMLLASLVPLAGAGFLTLRLLERSLTEQVRTHQAQTASAAAALVRDYLKDATTKLSSIARMLRPGEDPKIQTRRLNSLLDPPDIFLEVGYWTTGTEPVVQAQVQQSDYNQAQARNAHGNRSFRDNVGQYAQRLTNDTPQWSMASNGRPFVGSGLEVVESFPALPISVPAPGGALTANLDFRPVTQMLSTLAGERLAIQLIDARGLPLAGVTIPPHANDDRLAVVRPAGHADWSIRVTEPKDTALAPIRATFRQAAIWFAVAAAGAVALAALVAARITRPVKALASAADRIAGGDLSARAGIARADEIGQLAQAFDRMAAAVQQLDRLKGEFVAHVSHELRTPLASAKVALANVQEGIGGPDALARVQQDLDRLIRMVNELLDVARIEAGIPLAKHPTDLGALVRIAVETLRPLAKVALEVRGGGDTVDVDPARVQQIVLNLVDNALKYAKTRVDVDVRGREVRVADDGPGVPAEHRDRIFEKFARVETGPKPPGAGLGLSIARKLAELHGGTLACEGNAFVLRLP